MPKHYKLRTTLSLACLCLLPSHTLLAQRLAALETPRHTQHFFIEASLGHGKVEEKRDNVGMDDKGTFHNISAGYWLTPAVAIEASYAKFHDVSYTSSGTNRKDTKNHFYGAGLRTKLNISSNTELFASLGLGSTHRRVAGGLASSGNHEGLTTYYSAGSKIHINQQLDAMIKATASKEAFGHTHGVPPMYGVGAGLALKL